MLLQAVEQICMAYFTIALGVLGVGPCGKLGASVCRFGGGRQ